MARKPIIPSKGRVSPFFSPAVRSGRLLFVSGQAAIDEQGQVVSPGDCAAQSEYVMERLKTVLEAAGAGFDDVLKTTTFLTDAADYSAYNSVRARCFPKDPPASSTLIVAALVVPGLVVEVEAVAELPDGG